MVRLLAEIFGTLAGLAYGAGVLIMAASTGLWASEAWGFWAGCLTLMTILAAGAGVYFNSFWKR